MHKKEKALAFNKAKKLEIYKKVLDEYKDKLKKIREVKMNG